jgi:hypothetical protein
MQHLQRCAVNTNPQRLVIHHTLHDGADGAVDVPRPAQSRLHHPHSDFLLTRYRPEPLRAPWSGNEASSIQTFAEVRVAFRLTGKVKPPKPRSFSSRWSGGESAGTGVIGRIAVDGLTGLLLNINTVQSRSLGI